MSNVSCLKQLDPQQPQTKASQLACTWALRDSHADLKHDSILISHGGSYAPMFTTHSIRETPGTRAYDKAVFTVWVLFSEQRALLGLLLFSCKASMNIFRSGLIY